MINLDLHLHRKNPNQTLLKRNFNDSCPSLIAFHEYPKVWRTRAQQTFLSEEMEENNTGIGINKQK